MCVTPGDSNRRYCDAGWCLSFKSGSLGYIWCVFKGQYLQNHFPAGGFDGRIFSGT